MPFLPVVERELRVTARHPLCWWRRLLAAAAALVIFAFVYLVASRFQTPGAVGGDIFTGLAGAAMIYALLAGPLSTVDAISRERREGTLGLLYLTKLRSYDVVLGKLATASLDLLLGIAAILPIVAIPMLLGGVSLLRVAIAAVAIFNLAFLSLAAGICLSSYCRSGRVAFGSTVAFLILFSLVLPLILSEGFNIGPGHRLAPFFMIVCPAYTMELALGNMGKPWPFLLNMAGTHFAGWVLVCIACVNAARVWQDRPPAFNFGPLRRAKEWLSTFSVARNRRRTRKILTRNPVLWLESRQVLQGRLVRLIAGIAILVWLVGHLDHPRSWPDEDVVILWPMFGHYALCLWLALDAPRRLADDKQFGALELLLCTPLTPREIIAGNMRALWRRFGPPFLAMMMLYSYAVIYFQSRRSRVEPELNHLAWVGATVMAVQLYALARVGICQGLLSGNSLRATFSVGWRLGVLPWVLFFVGLLCLEYSGSRRSSFATFLMILGLWGTAHLVTCAVYLIRSNYLLAKRFRSLAASSQCRPWWQRLFC